MFPTPKPRNGFILIPVHQVTILHSSSVKRRGAAEARRAHNPDVLGSKPSGARFFSFIFSTYLLCILGGNFLVAVPLKYNLKFVPHIHFFY